METSISQLPENDPSLLAQAQARLAIRNMSEDEFIERFASGTLRKNKRLGMSYREQYLAERVAFEFGWEFRLVPRSRVTFGDARTEEDAPAVTEAGWHIDRYITIRPFANDYFQCKYLHIAGKDGRPEAEGIGIILRDTSASWLPKGHIVYAIVAEYDPCKDDFLPARNPC